MKPFPETAARSGWSRRRAIRVARCRGDDPGEAAGTERCSGACAGEGTPSKGWGQVARPALGVGRDPWWFAVRTVRNGCAPYACYPAARPDRARPIQGAFPAPPARQSLLTPKAGAMGVMMALVAAWMLWRDASISCRARPRGRAQSLARFGEGGVRRMRTLRLAAACLIRIGWAFEQCSHFTSPHYSPDLGGKLILHTVSA